MRQFPFSWIAAGVGLGAALALILGGGTAPAPAQGLPLLTRLFLSEFGFFVTLAGAVLGVLRWRDGSQGRAALAAGIACAVLAVGFLVMGIALWRGGLAA